MTTSHKNLGLALGFAGIALFGGTLPATRLAVTAFDPFFLSSARAFVAGCLGLVTLLITRRSWPSRRNLLELIFIATISVFAFPILLALGLQTVPASHGGVVLGVMPLGTSIAGALLTGERPSPGFWIASAAGCVIVLAFVFHRAGGIEAGIGDLYLFGVVVVGSVGYAMSGRMSTRMPGWEVISWQVVLFLPLTAAASIWWWPPASLAPSASAWAGFVYVATVSMYLAFFVFNAGMAMAGVARIGQLMLLQPFVIVALSVPVNGEPFELSTILYAAAVVAAVVFGQRMRVIRR